MAVATKRVSRKPALAGRRGALARELRSKLDELRALQAEHRHEVLVDPVPDDSYALATQTLLEELTIDALERERLLLNEIEDALERIELGEYGVCEGCGADIPQRRLEALPWARFCVSCAELRQIHWKN